MTFSDGSSVNFKSAASGWTDAANTVTPLAYNSVMNVVWLYVPTTNYQQTQMLTYNVADVYNQGWNDCLNACNLQYRYLYPSPMSPTGTGQYYWVGANPGPKS
jgi:hypothetical protein